MRPRRPVLLAIACFCALGLLGTGNAAAEGGLFDFLFGPDSDPAPRAAPERYERSWQRERRSRASHREDGEARSARRSRRDLAIGEISERFVDATPDGFCVRTCDGYFFPLIKSSRASRQQSCEFQCPSAPVEIYEGASIEQAKNAKGERYSALPAAFSFRDKATAQCTCNDPRSSHKFFKELAQNDPTLRAGDVVFEDTGAFVYNGSNLVSLGRASFVPTQIRERLHAMMRRNASMRNSENAQAPFKGPGPIPAPAQAHGSVEFTKIEHPTPGSVMPR